MLVSRSIDILGIKRPGAHRTLKYSINARNTIFFGVFLLMCLYGKETPYYGKLAKFSNRLSHISMSRSGVVLDQAFAHDKKAVGLRPASA